MSTESNSDRRLIPVAEAAAQLGVGRTTTYALIDAGELQVVKIGRRTLIPSASLDQYVERLTSTA